MTTERPQSETTATPRRSLPTWFGPTLLAGGLIGALGGLILLLAQRDLETNHTETERYARTAAADVADRLDANREYLRLFAEDLTRGSISDELFDTRLSRYLADHPELLFVAHLGGDGEVVRVAPETFAASLRGASATASELRSAIDAADKSGEAAYSAPHLLADGQRGFEVVIPLSERVDGTIVGVYDLDRLLRNALSRETILLHQAGFVDADGTLVTTLPALADVDLRLERTVAVDPPGHGLRIRLARYGGGAWSWAIAAVVAVCIGLALGSAYAIWMLNRQIERRRIVEHELEGARDRLEERVKERTAEWVDANRRLEEEMARRVKVEERSRQHQDQLAHVARLSTMGEMAAGLAHEINQPLAAIAAYTRAGIRLLKTDKPNMAKLREALRDSSDQAQRAGKIVHRLREFIAERATEHCPQDLGELVRSVAGLLEGELARNDVTCTLDLPGDLPEVTVDGIQIEQVVMNLMRNGIEAMETTPPDERKLVVRAERGVRSGVTLSVEDTGAGCGDVVPNRIFDPFYTTKPEGMGMGLSISQTIIEAHEGRVFANTRSGGGMSIGFHLPTSTEEMHHGYTEHASESSSTFGARAGADGVRGR